MKDKIRLLFSGDFAPLVDQDKISDNHFNTLNSLTSNVDAHITNLECPLTNSDKIIEKTGPAIKARPENVKLLKQAKVSIACLANNHIFDFGEQGITETLNVCHKNGIDTIGIVNRPDGRSHWIIEEIKGKKFGFLNYCEHEFSVRDEKLLGACGYNDIDAFYDIGKLKPKVDYLIVLYHGGNEYYPLPNPDMKKYFHYLADLGADAVIGHHTHVFSGLEIYNDKPLVYSLGNFFFPYPNEPDEWHKAVICKLEINRGIKCTLIPISQCKDSYDTTLLNETEANQILGEIERLSEIIIDDNILVLKWDEFSKIRGENIKRVLLYSTKVERLLFKYNYLYDFAHNRMNYKTRALLIKNIVRCHSLRKLFLDNMKDNK